jgi:hypothetical protein
LINRFQRTEWSESWIVQLTVLIHRIWFETGLLIDYLCLRWEFIRVFVWLRKSNWKTCLFLQYCGAWKSEMKFNVHRNWINIIGTLKDIRGWRKGFKVSKNILLETKSAKFFQISFHFFSTTRKWNVWTIHICLWTKSNLIEYSIQQTKKWMNLKDSD